jgi:cytochrome oxidase Cu insertion factor (SCO1/SenC/PrrC family)
MRRLPIVLLPVLLLLALLIGALLWRASDTLPRLGQVVESGTADIGRPFALTDQDGRPRRSADFAGRFMLIYFGYSHCPDVCPTTLALMGDAYDRLGEKKPRVVPIFITVDPARDTPKVLKTYLNAFGPEFVGLTGDDKSIANAAAGYRVYFRKQALPGGQYAMDHSSVIFLMGPDGRFVAYWDDTAIGPEKLAQELLARL